MEVTFQVSLYPIAQNNFRKPINGFIANLKSDQLKLEVHETSTIGIGDIELVFESLKQAYKQACGSGATIMVLTMVNEHPTREELNKLNE